MQFQNNRGPNSPTQQNQGSANRPQQNKGPQNKPTNYGTKPSFKPADRALKPQASKNNDQTVGGKTFLINDQIKASEVRVIDNNAQMLGVLSLSEAIKMAQDIGLDLVEVSPNAEPPVCRITNFGKMRYELQKKAADARKKQKVVETKEIKMSINIQKNDFDVKVKHIAKFIEHGDKVKVSVRMKGREITHMDLAKQIINDVLQQTESFAKAESNPKLEGMQIIAILVKK